ncbi:hypothetical protein PYW08_014058 [Mythimna loreyi]|uniref:Uncharacterized protein n=1 Tax=Mythimna loreyi TaxID=667449 RepID=A0ACC2R8X2_9NEOP|nr:hypothetical protein PYW08_014058 [Mythimna loreyi]
MNCDIFLELLSNEEKKAWNSFKAVVHGFLGKFKVRKWQHVPLTRCVRSLFIYFILKIEKAKMSDEIDIEEHDVMDNPTIKRIFPDLSVIKKEINQYNYDEDLCSTSETVPLLHLDQRDTVGEDSATLLDFNQREIIAKDLELELDLDQVDTIAKDSVPVLNLDQLHKIAKDSEYQLTKDIKKNIELVNTSPLHVPEAIETESASSFENKIILGTKPNLKYLENHHINFQKEPKLILNNVNSFLNMCKRFCKICLILFSKPNIYNLHVINVHTKKNNRQSKIKKMGIKLSEKLYKCNACHKILSSRCTLWRHFTNFHGDVKTLKRTDRPNNKIGTYKASQSKGTTGASCFHCQQLFPTQSSLIEHLYEVLEPNKIGSSDESKNLANTKVPNKEIDCNDRLIDDERAQRLKESNAHNENDRLVNTHPYSRDKVDTDKREVESILPLKDKLRRQSLDSIGRLPEYDDKNNKMAKRKVNIDPLQNRDINLRRIKVKNYTETTEQFNSKNELSKKFRNYSKFYKCFVCSKYIVSFEFYSRHIISDHNIKEVTKVKKVPFDSQCRFCPSKFSGFKSYNVHLWKYHKEQSKLTYFPREDEPVNRDHDKVDTTQRFALKSILYKCMKCDLHFLSCNAAMDHLKHLEISDTWKCSACQRKFGRENMVLHEKQHSFSQTFTVHTLTESTFSRILYRCNICTVHYSEENYLLHYLTCDSKTPNSLYCKVCDIIINRDDMKWHEINHKEKNIASCDFIVIEPDMIDDKHRNTNTENQNSNLKRDIHLSPKTVTEEIDEHDIIDEIEVRPNTAAKEKDKFDKIDDSQVSSNSADKNKDKFDKIDESQVSSNTADKKKDKSDIIDELHASLNLAKQGNNQSENTNLAKRRISPNRTKLKNKVAKRYEKSRFGNGTLVEYTRLAMSFCHTCKCFIGNMNLRKLHVEGKCGHMLKLVCNGCGLLLTTKTHETHKEYHKKEQISLQDYTFYDLRTEKRICPPIPEYPKCDSCGVHFLRNRDVKEHSCQEQDYITCNVCFMKLTEQAYKLHINFHSYSMPRLKTKLNKDTTLQVNTANEISNVELSSNDLNDPCITHILYTCKSCQMTVNSYDKVVQHCHDHYNSEVVKLNTQKCRKCTLIFQIRDYETHLNGKCNKESIKVVDFDPFYFRHNNDFWTKHIFAYVADEDISKILHNSIYRYECRLKLEKIQSGSSNSVLYKCDKCQVFIDPQYLYMHAVNSRDKSCVKLRKYPCALCGLCFGSTAYRIAHEKDHESIELNLKSHNIVLYNKEEHASYNKIMYLANNRYILYQCRNCERAVDKFDRITHNCDESNLKLCPTCGLLLDKEDFDLHFIRHEELDKFDVENIIVILFGIPKSCYLGKKKLSSTFNGTKYDYTIYKCKKCDLCLKTKKCILKHVCVFDDTKYKCSKCGLYFSELDYKNHNEIHENNFDLDDLNMNIVTVHPSPTNPLVERADKLEEKNDLVKQSEEVIENANVSSAKKEIIYRCECGLHFLEECNAQQHTKNCKCHTRLKVSKQSCIKCDLLFTPGELFNHLLKHHCDKKLQFEFDIVLVSNNEKKV